MLWVSLFHIQKYSKAIKDFIVTSFSILKDTRRAIATAAASWSNPAIKS